MKCISMLFRQMRSAFVIAVLVMISNLPAGAADYASQISAFRRAHGLSAVTLDGKLIVEVDGVTHDSDAERARDVFRTEVLERCGFHVVRVSNTDVYENLEGVLEMIAATLRIE